MDDVFNDSDAEKEAQKAQARLEEQEKQLARQKEQLAQQQAAQLRARLGGGSATATDKTMGTLG